MNLKSTAHAGRLFRPWLLAALVLAVCQWGATPILIRLLCHILPRFAPALPLPLILSGLRHFFPRFLWSTFALVAFFSATSSPTILLSRRFRMALEAISLALLSVVLFSLLLDFPVALYDEGLILTGAWRVSDGALPYRDFFTIYSPGQTTLLGGLFALFGKSLLLARFVDMAFRTAASLLVWSIVRPFLLPCPRLLCHVSFVLWIVDFGALLSPLIPFLCFTFLAISLILSVSTADHPLLPGTFSGLAMGAAMLFRHDLAVPSATALALLLCIPSMQPSRTHLVWRVPLTFALAALSIPLVVYGTLALAVPLRDLWEQLVAMPIFVFPAYRSLPYPSLRDVAASPLRLSPCFLTPALLVSVTISVSIRAIRKRTVSPCARRILFLAAFAASIFPYALGRSDVGHVLFCALPALPMAFLAIHPLRPRRFLCPLLALWTLSFGFLSLPSFRSVLHANLAQRQTLSELRSILANRPVGPIFVGESTHDRLVLNDVALYFLLDRSPGTKYFAFEPGVVTTPEIQDKMIRELQTSRVQTVILRTDAPAMEPNRSAEDSRSRRLDSFLRQNFAPIAHIPPYLVCAALNPSS